MGAHNMLFSPFYLYIHYFFDKECPIGYLDHHIGNNFLTKRRRVRELIEHVKKVKFISQEH